MKRLIVLDAESRTKIIPVLMSIWRTECLESKGPVRYTEQKVAMRKAGIEPKWLDWAVSVGWLQILQAGHRKFICITETGGNVARLEFTRGQFDAIVDAFGSSQNG